MAQNNSFKKVYQMKEYYGYQNNTPNTINKPQSAKVKSNNSNNINQFYANSYNFPLNAMSSPQSPIIKNKNNNTSLSKIDFKTGLMKIKDTQMELLQELKKQKIESKQDNQILSLQSSYYQYDPNNNQHGIKLNSNFTNSKQQLLKELEMKNKKITELVTNERQLQKIIHTLRLQLDNHKNIPETDINLDTLSNKSQIQRLIIQNNNLKQFIVKKQQQIKRISDQPHNQVYDIPKFQTVVTNLLKSEQKYRQFLQTQLIIKEQNLSKLLNFILSTIKSNQEQMKLRRAYGQDHVYKQQKQYLISQIKNYTEKYEKLRSQNLKNNQIQKKKVSSPNTNENPNNIKFNSINLIRQNLEKLNILKEKQIEQLKSKKQNSIFLQIEAQYQTLYFNIISIVEKLKHQLLIFQRHHGYQEKILKLQINELKNDISNSMHSNKSKQLVKQQEKQLSSNEYELFKYKQQEYKNELSKITHEKQILKNQIQNSSFQIQKYLKIINDLQKKMNIKNQQIFHLNQQIKQNKNQINKLEEALTPLRPKQPSILAKKQYKEQQLQKKVSELGISLRNNEINYKNSLVGLQNSLKQKSEKLYRCQEENKHLKQQLLKLQKIHLNYDEKLDDNEKNIRQNYLLKEDIKKIKIQIEKYNIQKCEYLNIIKQIMNQKIKIEEGSKRSITQIQDKLDHELVKFNQLKNQNVVLKRNLDFQINITNGFKTNSKNISQKYEKEIHQLRQLISRLQQQKLIHINNEKIINELKIKAQKLETQLINRNKDIEHLWKVKLVEYQNISQEFLQIKNIN